MKNFIISIVLVLFFLTDTFAQNLAFNTSDLRKVASSIGFKGVKNLKDLSEGEWLQYFNNIESNRALITQININSWGVCEHYNIDNFDIYNYYYKTISREKYNMYCKEINALMLIDGTIAQLN